MWGIIEMLKMPADGECEGKYRESGGIEGQNVVRQARVNMKETPGNARGKVSGNAEKLN
jgi:hypothetical protein